MIVSTKKSLIKILKYKLYYKKYNFIENLADKIHKLSIKNKRQCKYKLFYFLCVFSDYLKHKNNKYFYIYFDNHLNDILKELEED